MSRAHIFMTRTGPYPSQKTRTRSTPKILARTWLGLRGAVT